MSRLSTLARGAALCGLFVAASCSSTGHDHADDLAQPYALPECNCGSEDGLLHGCEFEACASGAGNPDNPECFCYSPLTPGGFRVAELLAAGGAGTHAAGATVDRRQRYIYLRSGKSYKGAVESDDGRTLVLLTVGGNQVTIPYADLAPRTVYALTQAKVATDDFDGQLEVANYARDNGLYGYAKRHYQRAERADSSRRKELEREVALLRRYASEAELAKAGEALAAGEARKARKHLANILEDFPGEPAAGVAEALFDEQFAREEQQRAAASTARPEELQRKLAPALKHLARAREHELKGLKNSRNQTQAIRSFDSAVSSAKSAYRLLDKLEKRKSSSPELLAAVQELKSQVKQVGVEAYVHAANAYLVRGSHYNAIESANAALLIDPASEGARGVRRRAEDAINGAGWGWGWYPGGRPGWGWGGGVSPGVR